jgi:hypothetical protein
MKKVAQILVGVYVAEVLADLTIAGIVWARGMMARDKQFTLLQQNSARLRQQKIQEGLSSRAEQKAPTQDEKLKAYL